MSSSRVLHAAARLVSQYRIRGAKFAFGAVDDSL